MAKKRSSNYFQASMFEPPEEKKHEPSSATPAPAITVCPKCGAKAARSAKGGEYIGVWYCTGACSYGENFYFTPGGDSTTSAPTSK